MIKQQRFNVLLQLQFYNIFTNVFSKVFTYIIKFHELPKRYNKKPKYCQTIVLAIIIYQANFMSQVHWDYELTPINFTENVPKEAKDTFCTKF